jgi:hypothetical protein
MVLDLKRFQPRRQLQEGLLWVAEQLPGIVEAADMTQVLARGYWPSYNVAFFPNIYDMAGGQTCQATMLVGGGADGVRAMA